MACRQPFSRHVAGGDLDDTGDPGLRLIGAYEFAAHAYGWTPRAVEEELSDEQLVAYLDAAHDRLEQHSTNEFRSLVEAVRAGTIFAHNKKAHDSWRQSTPATGPSRALPADRLEVAVMSLARTNPEYVVTGP